MRDHDFAPRAHITMINKRRMLADCLDACDTKTVRDEVAAHLMRRMTGRGQAVHEAACILDVTQEYGQPPRVVDEWHGDMQDRTAIRFGLIALCVLMAALIGITAARATVDNTMAQIERGAVEW